MEGMGGRRRGRETSMCGYLLYAPHWGPGLQPRHVPWLGIEPATLCFAGQHSIHWATPARAGIHLFDWVAVVYSLSLLYVPWCGQTKTCLSSLLVIDIWVVSFYFLFCFLLGTVLLRMFLYMLLPHAVCTLQYSSRSEVDGLGYLNV